MSNYEISKSSLLSLKAEILRKHEDLAKVKLQNVEKIKTIKKKAPLELKNKGVEERGKNDLNDEEQDLLKLSKSKLEAKAKLYEKLSGGSNENEELGRRYLVRFEKKNKFDDGAPSSSEDVPDLPVDSEDEEKHFSDEYDISVDRSEEWVEYTDCLGRSRKCLRKDIEYLKAKDLNLMGARSQPVPSVNSANDEPKIDGKLNGEESEKDQEDIESQISSKEAELISGDMRREMLRQQWEKEEEELQNKTEIHYQNVLFSEARQHGVGYYAFSKDEEERAKQQEALNKLREDTKQQQKKSQDLKALREKQLAARMKAARNRRRARLGLPPEEDDPTPVPEVKEAVEDDKEKQGEQKKAEETEKLLMEARKRHVRPWDVGKEGVNEHYEMTQQEWNEKKRQERIEQFAPPSAYTEREFRGMQSLERNFDENKSLKFSTKRTKKNIEKIFKSVDGYKSTNDQKITFLESELSTALSHDDNSDELLRDYNKSQSSSHSPSSASLRGLNHYKNSYSMEPIRIINELEEILHDDNSEDLLRDYNKSQSSSLSPSSASLRGLNPYKNSHSMEPIPIINELEESDYSERLIADYTNMNQETATTLEEKNNLEKYSRYRGVEVAPPPTFEYYGPGESKKPNISSGQVNISDSIEAGLRFLRKQAEKKGKHCVDGL